MSLDAQNPKGIQINVTSISTESKSIFKLMHSYHFLKANNGNILQIQRRNISWLSWCPLDIHHQVVTGRYCPFGHLPFSGFLASCRQRAKTAFASVLPGVKGKQSPSQNTGCLGPRPEGGLVLCPTPTQPLLCQQHRGALTLPLSRDPGQLPMGQLGFKILQNIQELIELSNNKCLFFSEASFNTHEENPVSKQLVFTCHL